MLWDFSPLFVCPFMLQFFAYVYTLVVLFSWNYIYIFYSLCCASVCMHRWASRHAGFSNNK